MALAPLLEWLRAWLRQRDVRGSGPDPMKAILRGREGLMEWMAESSMRVRST